VAVKVLHPALAAGLGPQRFLREIRFAAALQHPHILPLHDSGEVAGLLYYVMPYVEGETLRAYLDRDGRLPVKEAVRIAQEVLDALGYAHRHGVVHRDIKPENILLSEGHALVADFGIAKVVAEAAEANTPVAADGVAPAGMGGLTETGWRMGTPAYMSPEQIGGGAPVDGRSDLYGLGCVLHEMLTGEPPFTGPTPAAILAQHLRDPVGPLRERCPDVREEVERAVVRSLAKAPEERFATAAEFANALQRALAVRGTKRLAVLLATGIFAVTAAVIGTALVRHRGAGSTPPHAAMGVAPYGPHQTKNLGAYDLYTQGREAVLGGARTEERQIKAIKYFKQAIAVDSTYAAAYAELAYMYFTVQVGGGLPGLSRLKAASLAHATALKAAAMDSTLADGWAVLGLVSMSLHDIPSAKAALDRALALDPSSPRVHSYLSSYYGWLERPAESLAEAQRESELDPLSVLAGIDLAGALYNSGRYEEALAEMDKLRDVDPPLARTGLVTGAICLSKGMMPEAIRNLRDWDEEGGWLGRALALAGRRAEARRMLAKKLAHYTMEEGAEDIALMYEGLGDYDQTFVWLEKAIDDHSLGGYIMWPTFAHLRADPRFERIRRRLNGSGIAR
jgi:tetratricopeptide (TPR) repeat protein